MWCIRVTLHCRLLGDLEVVEEIGSDGVSQSVSGVQKRLFQCQLRLSEKLIKVYRRRKHVDSSSPVSAPISSPVHPLPQQHQHDNQITSDRDPLVLLSVQEWVQNN